MKLRNLRITRVIFEPSDDTEIRLKKLLQLLQKGVNNAGRGNLHKSLNKDAD